MSFVASPPSLSTTAASPIIHQDCNIDTNDEQIYDNQVMKQQQRNIIFSEGDTVKGKYWAHFKNHYNRDSSAIFFADKNVPFTTWSQVGQICNEIDVIPISIIPDFFGKNNNSIGRDTHVQGSSSLFRTTSIQGIISYTKKINTWLPSDTSPSFMNRDNITEEHRQHKKNSNDESEEGDKISIMRRRDDSIHHHYPFSLFYLAICIARVMERRGDGSDDHKGKLDCQNTKFACLIVVKFFSLYRGIKAEHFREKLKAALTKATTTIAGKISANCDGRHRRSSSPIIIEVPFFDYKNYKQDNSKNINSDSINDAAINYDGLNVVASTSEISSTFNIDGSIGTNIVNATSWTNYDNTDVGLTSQSSSFPDLPKDLKDILYEALQVMYGWEIENIDITKTQFNSTAISRSTANSNGGNNYGSEKQQKLLVAIGDAEELEGRLRESIAKHRTFLLGLTVPKKESQNELINQVTMAISLIDVDADNDNIDDKDAIMTLANNYDGRNGEDKKTDKNHLPLPSSSCFIKIVSIDIPVETIHKTLKDYFSNQKQNQPSFLSAMEMVNHDNNTSNTCSTGSSGNESINNGNNSKNNVSGENKHLVSGEESRLQPNLNKISEEQNLKQSDEYTENNADDDKNDIFILDTHITMAHHSQVSQESMHTLFDDLIGYQVAVKVTGMLWNERIAALAVEILKDDNCPPAVGNAGSSSWSSSSLARFQHTNNDAAGNNSNSSSEKSNANSEKNNGDSGARSDRDNQQGTKREKVIPPSQNKFPHITIWHTKDAQAVESNDLPQLAAMGKAQHVLFSSKDSNNSETNPPILLRGTLSYWMLQNAL